MNSLGVLYEFTEQLADRWSGGKVARGRQRRLLIQSHVHTHTHTLIRPDDTFTWRGATTLSRSAQIKFRWNLAEACDSVAEVGNPPQCITFIAGSL